MKRFISPLTDGVPIFADDLFQVLQEEQYDILKGILNKIYQSQTEGIVVSGVVVSDNGGNFDTTAGVVFLDGDFYRIDAQTAISNPSYIVPDADVVTNRQFGDLSNKQVFVTKKATVQGTIPGAGQYITIDALGENDYFNPVVNVSGGLTVKKKIALGDWNMDSTASLAVTHGITDLIDKVDVAQVWITPDTDAAGAADPDDRFDLSREGNVTITPATVSLTREGSGIFDSTNFDATSFNRGFLTIIYTES